MWMFIALASTTIGLAAWWVIREILESEGGHHE
jgi:hypothetical protein